MKIAIELEKNKSEKYKFETIYKSKVYIRKVEDQLSGLFYLGS